MKAAVDKVADGTVVITIICEDIRDTAIAAAIANSSWIGQAIRGTFGEDWKCPFYRALKAAGVEFSNEKTFELKRELARTCKIKERRANLWPLRKK